MIGSNHSPWLAIAALVWLGFEPAVALETVTIGEGGDLDWKSGGEAAVTSIQAEYLAPPDPNNPGGTPQFLIGNTPGDLLELDNPEPALSIHPQRLAECPEGSCLEANLADATRDRGGSVRLPTFSDFTLQYKNQDLQADLDELVSSNPGGEESAIELKKQNAFGQLLIINMGARFGVNRIRFYPRNTVQKSPGTPFHADFLRAYESFTNDGVDLTDSGNPIWDPLNVERDNKEPVVDILVEPPRYVQSIRLKSLTQFDFEIDEIEVYGQGYLPSATYLSDIFDAGEPVAWLDLRWTEDVVGDADFTRMQIRTRTGRDDSPFRFTRKLRGKPAAEEIFSSIDDATRDMTRAEYEDLPSFDEEGREFEPASVLDDLVNWSPFSTPFPAEAANGSPIISPSPRRYFQFQVQFESEVLDATRILRALSFDFAEPIADAIIGEIFPREVEPSKSTSFIYAVRPSIETEGVIGFDTITISTQTRVEAIDRLEIRAPSDELISWRDFTSLEDTSLVDGFQILSADEGSFAVRFPLVREDGANVRVYFRTSILTYSTNFSATASASTTPGASQSISSGNAGFLGEGDIDDFSGTTVLSPQTLTSGLLAQVELEPAVFTPNGDNVNDVVSVRYSLLSLSALRPVNVSVFDLAGRLVRVLHDAPQRNGHFEDIVWDGLDDSDDLVAPGIYLVRVIADGDSRSSEQLKAVAVAY